MTGAVSESGGAAACWACGLGPVNASTAASTAGSDAAEHDSQRSHHRSHAEESPVVKHSLPIRRLPGAPKYSPRHPTAQPDPGADSDCFIRLPTSSRLLAAEPADDPPDAVPAARPATPPFRRAKLRKPSTARRSPSSSQHQLTGPVRCASATARATSAASRGMARTRLSSMSLRVKVAETPFPHQVEPAELPVPDAVLPGPPPAHPHEPHRLHDATRLRAARCVSP